jgi:nitroreductase
MIKVVFSWKDHPDLSAAECEARYRAVHIPLARAAFEGVEGFRELRFNRVRRETVNDYNRREPREVEADVDAWVELYFESAELMQRAFERPQLGELFDDHPNWMECDTPANIRVYHVDETVIHAAPRQLALEDALRHTGAARSFHDRPVSRETLRRVLDVARFAPSGGNKQSWRVISVEDPAVRARIHELSMDIAKEYLAMNAAGQRAFGLTQHGRWPGPGDVDLEAARRDSTPTHFDGFAKAPALLVVACQTGLLAAMDAELDRHGIVAGASVYPFCWSVLLAARLQGLGGVMSTFVVRQEPAILDLLHVPEGHAIVAAIYLGYPEKQPTKLTRRAVDDFAFVDTFGGESL